ncbi:MAG: peptidylprolyl isomerase [archaeon]
MLKKNDFIEIDFTAVIKETGAVFDTTLSDEAAKTGLLQGSDKEKFQPLKMCIGHGMVVRGLDNALEGKEAGKWNEKEIVPSEAFGERDAKLVKIIPLRIFREKGVMPQAGMMLNLDGILVRIASVSSGRVIADFNNPLAGKNIIYKFRINRKIDSEQEKLEILTDFLLGKPKSAKIENGKGIIEFIVKLPEAIEKEFVKRAKDILGIDVEIQVAKPEIEKKKD